MKTSQILILDPSKTMQKNHLLLTMILLLTCRKNEHDTINDYSKRTRPLVSKLTRKLLIGLQPNHPLHKTPHRRKRPRLSSICSPRTTTTCLLKHPPSPRPKIPGRLPKPSMST